MVLGYAFDWFKHGVQLYYQTCRQSALLLPSLASDHEPSVGARMDPIYALTKPVQEIFRIFTKTKEIILQLKNLIQTKVKHLKY